MTRKVFTYKDIEEARGYIGKSGWFGRAFMDWVFMDGSPFGKKVTQ